MKRHYGLPNPEAPLDGLNDHWREPPNADGSWWSIIIAMLVSVAACGILVYACSASAHMKNRPDLDQWFNGLTSKNGSPCCSTVDGTEVRDIDWDTTVENGQSHYRVRVGGQWITVADHQVVTTPNKYGGPVVWIYHSDGKPQVRCFMPGAGG